ncbi:BMA-ORC-5 [Dirofilaria immitis]|nr:BMA-ORC-5 [Dirofilaria immitis]
MSAMEATCSKKLWQIVSVLRCRNSSITHLHVYGTTAGPKDEVMQKVIEEIKENDEVCFPVEMLLRVFHVKKVEYVVEEGLLLYWIFGKLSECKTELQYVKSVVMVIILNNAEMLLNFPPSFCRHSFPFPKGILHDDGPKECLIISIKSMKYFLVYFTECLLDALLFQYGGTIKLVSVARLPWTRFEITEHISSPVQFAFEALSKSEVQEALSTRLNFDNNFIRCMLDMVYSVCRDLNQLSYIIEKLWDTGSSDGNWANNAASNKLKTCYTVRGQNRTDDLFYRSEKRPVEGGQTFCLSTSAKYLLIAAYCAKPRKQRRRAPATKGLRNNFESAHEIGPKPFPVQRLLFIYLAMLEKHDMRNHCAADIHAQVAELCAMGFLNRVSADGNLDTPKYRCIATFEFSEQLAS